MPWKRHIGAITVVVALLGLSLVLGAPPASAVPTPTISGTSNNSPTGFLASNGQAPNPNSFCESPDYFDEWNRNPAATAADGPWTIDTGPGQFGGGITATLVENNERVEQSTPAWGIRFGGGGNGTVTLSQPVFYSQWVVNDMDIVREGFEATATLGGNGAPVTAVAAFGANATHLVTATQPNMASVIRNASGNVRPWDFVARAQIDFLGPIDQVVWNKVGGGGALSGFLPSMGCAAVGSAKEVSSPAVWDPATQTFSTQYTIRVRSNMPNAATIANILNTAATTLPAAAVPASLPEIPINDLQIVDSLVVPGATVQSVNVSSTGSIAALLNPAYDGVGVTELLIPGFALAPESTETITLDIVYVPDLGDPSWADGCHSWTNQAEVTGVAATADVGDVTDEGTDPRAAELNGDDSVDTPTLTDVCLTPEIDVTKTLAGTPVLNGDGTIDVAYDLDVANIGNVDLDDVSVTDDLVATFGAGSTITNIATSATGPCAGGLNPGFDGTGTTELLAGGVTIPAVGVTTCAISLSFTVDPGSPVVLSPGTTYLNTVDAVSQTSLLPVTSDSDTETFTQILPAEPSWTVTKATASTPAEPGDTLTYTFTIVNTGNTTVSGVTVDDAKCATTPALDTESVATNGILELSETMIWSCTSVGVTPGEVDAAMVDNAVTVEGTPEQGTIEPATDELSTPIAPDPSWAVGKTNTTVPSAAGDTIEYSFAIVNTGNVTISGIAVADAKCATVPALDSESIDANGVLDFDETQVWSCTSIPVTQAEVDAGVVNNSVAVAGTPAGGGTVPDATDTHSVPVSSSPSWEVVKAATTLPGNAGDSIQYSFTIVNTGNVTISGVAVTDAKCATTPVIDSESLNTNVLLEVGETQVWSCTSIPVTQAEVDAGVVNNDVSVTGTPAGGTLPPATDDHQTPISANPSWEIVKAAATIPSRPGDTINYTFTVINTGNVTINGVAVTDTKCAAAPTLDSESINTNGVLDPGENQVWTCTSIPVTAIEVDTGNVNNTVTATGTPAGGTLPPTTDTLDTPITPAPSWSVAKTNTTVPTEAGQTIDYSFAVANTGNVTISGVAVADAKCATVPALDSESIDANGVLDFDETQIWTCTSIPVTQAEVDAGVVNNDVSVTGTPADGTLAPATDDHTVPVTADPSWDVVKATASLPTEAGETIDYTFTVVNTGNVTITVIAVTDAKCATTPVIDSESVAANTLLDAGETQVWSCTSIPVTQAEVDAGVVNNDVSVTGTPAGGTLPPATDDHQTPISANPSWEIVKAAATIPSRPGDTINYTFTVINTGNVTINGVAVTDTKCAAAPTLDSESINTNGVLDPGENQVWTCTSIPVTAIEVDTGNVNNTVTATGTPAGGTLPPTTDTLDTPITPAPSWSVVKASSSAPTEAGELIEYTFTVINTGNVSVSGVAIDDAKCAADPTLDSESIDANGVLDFDETQVWTCTSIPVTQAEVDAGEVLNTATATGTPAGGTLAPATDDHVVPIDPNPSWSVTKASSSTLNQMGDTLEYSFTVVNDGNVTITGVAVDDAKCAAIPTIDSESIDANIDLDAGETQIWSCTSIPVTQGEVDAGMAENSVSITGTPAGGTLDPIVDDHTVFIEPAPAFEVVKATSSEPTIAGEVLTYTFTIINTGNVTITDVAVDDPKCATIPSINSESIVVNNILEFGETQIWTCTSIPVTQAEVDAGQVLNTVTATGTPADGVLPQATDDLVTPITPAPSWAAVKATATAPTQAGDTLEYTFTIINTGNVSINGASVTDPKCATIPSIDSESITDNGILEFGETQIWSCTSIPVTQAEVDAGAVLNTVTATGTPAGGTLPPATDVVTTPIDPRPSWEVVKAAGSAPGVVGETIEYTFTVVNTGNVTIAGVVLADGKCAAPPVLDAESITTNGLLEFGESQTWSCTSIPVTQDEIDAGEVLNTVTATGTPSGGTLPVASDDHIVQITAAPSWEVVKASTSVPSTPGETVDYTFTVVNTGNVTITGVAVADAKCAAPAALVTETIAANGVLEFGETQIWSCTSIPVTAAEVDAGVINNAVLVTGTPSGGELAPAADDHDILIAPSPDWVASKTALDAPTQAGQTIRYVFSLTNTGNVTIAGVIVSDPKCGTTPLLESETVDANGLLDFGETQTWTCTSVPVTQAEVDAGVVDNTVSVTGTPPGGTLPLRPPRHRHKSNLHHPGKLSRPLRLHLATSATPSTTASP